MGYIHRRSPRGAGPRLGRLRKTSTAKICHETEARFTESIVAIYSLRLEEARAIVRSLCRCFGASCEMRLFLLCCVVHEDRLQLPLGENFDPRQVADPIAEIAARNSGIPGYRVCAREHMHEDSRRPSQRPMLQKVFLERCSRVPLKPMQAERSMQETQVMVFFPLT